MRLFLSTALLFTLASCTVSPATSPPQNPSSVVTPKQPYAFGAASRLIGADGVWIGNVQTTEFAGMPAIGIVAYRLPYAELEMSLHAVGDCSGGHFSNVGPPLPLIPPLVGTFRVPSSGPLTVTTNIYGAKFYPSDFGNKPALLDKNGAALLLFPPGTNSQPIACAVVPAPLPIARQTAAAFKYDVRLDASAVPAADATASKKQVPRGATIGPDGHATIIDAPPAPFSPVPPAQPQPPSPGQLAGQEQFRRASEFQRQVGAKAHTVANFLRVAEKGNFVDFYFENEGEPHVVFRFLRNGRETLAKYIRDPRFVGTDAQYTDEQLIAAMDFMLATFREDRVIIGGSAGSKRNRAVVRIAVTEPEFRALVARKGITIPEAVELEFAADQPAGEINRPLRPEIARLIRIFPRHDRPLGPVPDTSSSVKVVLRDGCFRAADQGNALVLFPLGAQLFIDRAGYLAFAPEVAGYGRVGEEVWFHGIPTEVTAPELVRPIHAACGQRKVLMINGMRSAAAERAQDVVETNADAFRHFRTVYGLPEATARKALERCKARHDGICLVTPPAPPPPGVSQENCPPGTKLSFGICRTPEGYIRPLPKWVQELIQGETAELR